MVNWSASGAEKGPARASSTSRAAWFSGRMAVSTSATSATTAFSGLPAKVSSSPNGAQHGSKPGEFGGPEKQGSRFAGPHFISLDSKGRLYTTEGCQARVQQFSLAGNPLAAWGNDSQEPGGFGATKFVYSLNPFSCIAVFVDPHDRVWVSSLNDRVQAFTPEGKYLLGIAGSGSEAGQLARPHGMAMDSKGHLYVCDAGNERIQKFEISHP